MRQAKDELAELVAFKSVADAKQFPPEECEQAAQWMIDVRWGRSAGARGTSDT